MSEIWLTFTLLSEACFSRGDGVPGVVDVEVSHDENGFPYLGGRALKGLLHAEAAELLDALARSRSPSYTRWAGVTERLFGRPGSDIAQEGQLSIDDAQMPADLRAAWAYQVRNENEKVRGRLRTDILNSLTTIRRQTKLDESGAPEAETLRAVRVILRETPFAARLIFFGDSSADARADELALLAAVVKAWRRAGSNKTRGYGRLTAALRETVDSPDVTDQYFARFKAAVIGTESAKEMAG